MGLPGLVVLLQFASWQVLLVGILVFFLYVAALAVYKKFTEVEDRKEELEKKLAERQKRRAINDLLGEMMEEGKSLRSYHSAQRNANLHAAHKWVKHTQDLIEAAFDKAQAQYFRGDEIDRGLDPVEGCLSRLEQVARSNFLEVNSDFVPQDWEWIRRR